MITSMKVLLKPNNKQRSKLFQYAGTSRFAYNWALDKQQENYKNGGKFLSDQTLRKRFTQLKQEDTYQWLYTVSNNVAKQAIKDACDAYKKFFKGQAKYPTFKTKKGTKPSFYQDPLKIQFTATHVKVEGFAESKRKNKQKLNRIRLVEKDRIPYGEGVKYANPRITFDGLHWWVSVGVIVYTCLEYPKHEGVGIDLGITKLGHSSNGSVYPNINKTKKVRVLEKKKRWLQRKVSRKYQYNQEGERYKKTCNIIKSEQQLLTISKRLTNIRQNYLHQITSDIVNRKPTFIVLEDLNVCGMMKNKHLAKAIQQQKFYEFRRQVAYKSERHGIQFILADRWYPSSKLCFHCRQLKKDLKLSDRLYICACGNRMDRDVQAALNLKRYGERNAKCIQLVV